MTQWCKCEGGPYIGAQRVGLPVRCQRCMKRVEKYAGIRVGDGKPNMYLCPYSSHAPGCDCEGRGGDR